MINSFGRDLEIKKEPATTVMDFREILLCHLEGYLFNTNPTEKIINIKVPAIGLEINRTVKSKITHEMINIPHFSFSEKGCKYSENGESVYVSPAYFAKCFIERIVEALNITPRKYIRKPNNADPDLISSPILLFKNHINFKDIYDKLITLKKVYDINTCGAGMFVPEVIDRKNADILIKFKIAAYIQDGIDFVIEDLRKQIEQDYFYNLSRYIEDSSHSELMSEYYRLFRTRGYIRPLRDYPEDYINIQTQGNYTEGTDAEREAWKEKLQAYMDKCKELSFERLKNERHLIHNLAVPFVNYFKIDIVAHDWKSTRPDRYGVSKKDEFGLDIPLHFGHPSDINHLERPLPNNYADYDDCVSLYDKLYNPESYAYDQTWFDGDFDPETWTYNK